MRATGHRRRLTAVLILWTAAILLSACGAATTGGSGDALDGDWVLAEGTGPEGDIELEVPGDERAQVTLNIEGPDWGGTAACNSYSGTVRVDDDTIDTEGFAVTEMACEPLELMTTESRYLAALQSVDSAEVTTADDAADALTLTGPDTLLRFTREPEGDEDSVDG
jgi:heat shock protein HslJ